MGGRRLPDEQEVAVARRGPTSLRRALADWPLAVALFSVGVAGCRPHDNPATSPSRSTLTIGYGLTSGQSSQTGLQQALRNIAVESLVAIARDGRVQPWFAEDWSTSPDGLTVRIVLRRGAKFHDGTVVDGEVIKKILLAQLPDRMGPAFEDVDAITASGDEIVVSLKQRSAVLMEGLDVLIQKDGPTVVGTGPYYLVGQDANQLEMRANDQYHGGKPLVDSLVIRPYSSVRAAWADMLRGRIDMLYEVGSDGLESLESSSSVAIFTFPRPYQYLAVLNPRSSKLSRPEVRRALNSVMDRKALVRDALDGHGLESVGPVHPNHWAFEPTYAKFDLPPREAARILSGAGLEITCLVPPDASYERLALVLKRQLEAAGVRLSIREATNDQINAAFRGGTFDAALIDVVSGPSILRPYRWWHSRGPQNVGFSSPDVDAALDRVRHAANDDDYRKGVHAFQQAIVQDPPAIFLAWTERARAVSTRFEVPVDPGRDILSTLRRWRTGSGALAANRN